MQSSPFYIWLAQPERASTSLPAVSMPPTAAVLACSIVAEADLSASSAILEADLSTWLDSDPLMNKDTNQQPQLHHHAVTQDHHPFFQLGPILQDPAELQTLHQMLEKGIGLIWKLSNPAYTAAQKYTESDSAWSARMLELAPDPDCFQGGRMHSHVALLDKFFARTQTRSANSRRVRTWIRHGIKLPFVGLSHPSHARVQHWNRNLVVVKRMLSKALGTSDVSAHLEGTHPSPVQFPKHKSVPTYAPFVEAEIAKAEAKGVIAKWPLKECPTVVNGIKVVDDKPDKPRISSISSMCINPMYLNAFLEHQPLQYEKLQDLINLIGQGDYMTSSDDKSG